MSTYICYWNEINVLLDKICKQKNIAFFNTQWNINPNTISFFFQKIYLDIYLVNIG